MAVAEIEREVQVLAVFRQLLNVPALGPEENFFEAGGSSLLASRLAARLRSTGVLDVATSAIFAAPTARTLTRYASNSLPGVQTQAESAPATNGTTAVIDIAREPASIPVGTTSVDRGARQRAAFARLRPAAATTTTAADEDAR